MTNKEFIDIICPEHSRTSCSDDNIFNGFYVDEDSDIIEEHYPRCRRCALLEIENGSVKINDLNKETISKLL